MLYEDRDTVLFVCNSQSISTEILEKLNAAGFGIVGPTPRAATALALAAQTPPTMAIIAGDLTGKRSPQELAEDLMGAWGVQSWIWSEDEIVASDAGDPDWAVRGERLDRLRRVFG